MFGLNATLGSRGEESLQPFVPKALDRH
jgi:hypothetical protein